MTLILILGIREEAFQEVLHYVLVTAWLLLTKDLGLALSFADRVGLWREKEHSQCGVQSLGFGSGRSLAP